MTGIRKSGHSTVPSLQRFTRDSALALESTFPGHVEDCVYNVRGAVFTYFILAEVEEVGGDDLNQR